jgi:hypothetical protein
MSASPHLNGEAIGAHVVIIGNNRRGPGRTLKITPAEAAAVPLVQRGNYWGVGLAQLIFHM